MELDLESFLITLYGITDDWHQKVILPQLPWNSSVKRVAVARRDPVSFLAMQRSTHSASNRSTSRSRKPVRVTKSW
jgi:hypothetical protein